MESPSIVRAGEQQRVTSEAVEIRPARCLKVGCLVGAAADASRLTVRVRVKLAGCELISACVKV
jgi:hypothetical protein